MIWSVSTSARSSTATRPVDLPRAPPSPLLRAPGRRRSGRRSRPRRPSRADEMRAAAGALAALEVAVRGRRAALARRRGCRGSCRGTSSSPPRATRSRRSMKTRSRPSSSAWRFTCAEPGTTIACTASATRRPATTAAAARRSSMREFVHEPMKTRSIADLLRSASPARGPCSVSARSAASRSAGSSKSAGSGTRPSTGATMPGVRPPGHLRRQRGDVDLDRRGRSARPRRVGSARHASSARSQAAPVGRAGRPSR